VRAARAFALLIENGVAHGMRIGGYTVAFARQDGAD